MISWENSIKKYVGGLVLLCAAAAVTHRPLHGQSLWRLVSDASDPSVFTFSIQTTPAEAAGHSMVGMTCKDAAKMQYPNDRKTRRAFKKACKENWKASQGG